MIIGIALTLWNVRQRMTSRWGMRLNILGVSVTFLVPGVLILVAVISGQMLWPAAVAAILAIPSGIGFLAVLRKNWTTTPRFELPRR